MAFRQGPVSIVFAIRDRYRFLNGSEVSEQLRNLSVVEFSFYLGFPVQQIAEREYLLLPNAVRYFCLVSFFSTILGISDNAASGT